MIKNYFTISLRSMKRNLGYSFINVFGLALGITCSLVLFLMITFYTSFDNYHPNKNRIYRLVASSDNNGREDFTPGVEAPLPEAVRNDISGVEHVLYISGSYNGLFTVEANGRKNVFEQEDGFGYTDSTYFIFFKRNILVGNYKTALSEPNQVLLSQSMAKKFFGEEEAVGKLVRFDNAVDLKVSGVMEDHPGNTNFPFEILISFATIKPEEDKRGWNSTKSDDQCYVMLAEGVDPAMINAQFPKFNEKYEGKEIAAQIKRWLQPLGDISYDNRFVNYRYSTLSKSSILAMGAVALFLLLTACINFINLSTAVAVKRSKEVGIRKVLGSQRAQLITQYLAETGLITLVAIFLSVGLAELTLISLNSFLKLDLHVDLLDLQVVAYLGSVWLVVSLVSGFYPALLLSGFSPALALKNKITNRSAGGFALRRGLVVFQFVISQLLIVGTVILLSQMQFIRNKDLGFAKEAVITVPIPENAPLNKKKALRSELGLMRGVERASLCFTLPSSGSVASTNFKLAGVEGDFQAQVKLADQNYLELFEMSFIQGTNISDLDTANACVVNEKLVRAAGLEPEEILGRKIKIWGMDLPVLGVVKDFHTVSLENEIDPTIIFNGLDRYYELAIKLKAGSFNETIPDIEKAWKAQYPDYLFSYDFLDQEIAEFYESDQKMSTLLIAFSSIAIIIGCLGLYGLISFMANEREKEIGVRKVLGASANQIMTIFSKELLVLIGISFLIASPFAGYVMNQWLEGFEYHIDLNWTMFIGGVAVTFVIALVTMGYRTFKAAYTNPVNTLRSE